jgi:dTDP-glucose pyrophosphorylase
MHLKKLITGFYEEKPEAIFLLKKMADVRRRGIAQTTMIRDNMFMVHRVEEKPDHPFSNFAIEPVYIFKRSIFDCLQKLRPGRDNEVQLTDGIQLLAESGRKVLAVGLTESDLRLDIGNPESYWEALRESFNVSQQVLNNIKT